MDRMVLTSDTSIDGATSLVGMKLRRCRGCAKCMYENPGSCVLDDDFSKVIPDIMSSDALEVHSDLDGNWFAMPMRKAVERIGNILEAWTDSGNNIPRDPSEIGLRRITVVVPLPEDPVFEASAREVMEKGPVSVEFRYR